MLDHAAIARLIPHAGGMCLLDRVVEWSDAAITCTARSHRAPDNPLRRDGTLPAVCGIELGLQAAAVHGALRAGARQPVGYLVRLGDVALGVETLDGLGDELIVDARVLQALANGHSYSFTVTDADAGTVIDGRATIALVG